MSPIWEWLDTEEDRASMDIPIKVHNRESLSVYEEDKPHFVISITDPQAQITYLPDNIHRLGILRMQFHDLDRPGDDYIFKEYVLFQQSDAKKIWDFAEPYLSKVKSIHVGCEAGISRSAGVAAAISKVRNSSDQYYFKRYIPNRRVYSMLLAEWYSRKDKAA